MANTVLLVDNDDDMSAMFEKYLVKHGFLVGRAKNAIEVLRIVREQVVKIALVENDLESSNGEEIVSCIRSTPKGGTIPIVLLSSRAFVFDIARYLKLGVDRCLSKPVSLHEIAATTRRLIDESVVLEEGSSSGSLPVVSDEPGEPFPVA